MSLVIGFGYKATLEMIDCVKTVLSCRVFLTLVKDLEPFFTSGWLLTFPFPLHDGSFLWSLVLMYIDEC